MLKNGDNATDHNCTLDTTRPATRAGLRGNPQVSPAAASQGLDLSRPIHGAGGIGGLLATEEPQGTYQGTYWFFYDAEPLTRRATRSVGAAGPRAKPARRVKGNGNLTQVLDATDTNNISIAAHYEYDPYGNVINNLSSYTYATANPFRFSTKWFDEETHLGYWGYRYYSPRLGRWISRDPIGERGGLNLSSYVLNDVPNRLDPIGLYHGIGGLSWPDPNDNRNLCDDCWQTCLNNQHLAETIQPGGYTSRAFGFVLCRADGCRCACLDMSQVASIANGVARNAIVKCALVHEESHVQSNLAGHSHCPPCSRCDRWFHGHKVCGRTYTTEFEPELRQMNECRANADEIRCLYGELDTCNGDTDCIFTILDKMNGAKEQCEELGGDVFKWGAPREPWWLPG